MRVIVGHSSFTDFISFRVKKFKRKAFKGLNVNFGGNVCKLLRLWVKSLTWKKQKFLLMRVCGLSEPSSSHKPSSSPYSCGVWSPESPVVLAAAQSRTHDLDLYRKIIGIQLLCRRITASFHSFIQVQNKGSVHPSTNPSIIGWKCLNA